MSPSLKSLRLTLVVLLTAVLTVCATRLCASTVPSTLSTSSKLSQTPVIPTTPKSAEDFFNRGKVRASSGDQKGAIADYTQAIKLQPNYATAHYNRGVAIAKLHKQQAIADLTQAIKLQPDYAAAYNNRGLLRFELGDQQGAAKDLQQAANLFEQQGNTELYQRALDALNLIRKL